MATIILIIILFYLFVKLWKAESNLDETRAVLKDLIQQLGGRIEWSIGSVNLAHGRYSKKGILHELSEYERSTRGDLFVLAKKLGFKWVAPVTTEAKWVKEKN